MEEIKEGFLRYISLKRSGSEDTRKGYDHDLGLFIDFLNKRDIDDFAAVDKIVVLDYLSELKEGKLTGGHVGPATYARNLSCLKSFFRYLNSNLGYENNPCINIRIKARGKALPDFLTFQQVERMLESCNISEANGVRNRMAIELLYATGMRVSELVNVRISDIDVKNQLIKVTGKGNKERLVPYYESINELMLEYFRNYRNLYSKGDCDYLFINRRGSRLSVRSVELIVGKQAVAAGIEQKVYPHMLRHSFATHILDGGANLRVVQELLGHENLSTTTIYTHVTTDKLQEVIREKHPHSDKGK